MLYNPSLQQRGLGQMPSLESRQFNAVWGGEYRFSNILLRYGPLVKSPKDWAGRSLLHIAVGARSEDIMFRTLLQHGVSIDDRNSNGQTALELAQSLGEERIVSLLLAAKKEIP